jgi:hypothetical protein
MKEDDDPQLLGRIELPRPPIVDVSRRDFLIGASALLAAGQNVPVLASSQPRIAVSPDPQNADVPASLKVDGDTYSWSWTAKSDVARIEDRKRREIASAELQPVVALQINGQLHDRPGKIRSVRVQHDRCVFFYFREDVKASLTVEVRFASDRLWYGPALFESSEAVDVVELRWFSALDGETMQPRLSNNVLVVPGIDMSPAISPILAGDVYLDTTFWLGRGATPSPGLFQQWGLPVHYFCGYNLDAVPEIRGSVPARLSCAFCCGLTSLPEADMLLHTANVRHSLIFRYNSDLCGHARTPGSIAIGAGLVWTFGATVQDAIRAYYHAVVESGSVQIAPPSAEKRANMTASVYSMWGAQTAAGTDGVKLTQDELEDAYRAFRSTGLRMDVFEIEDRWESGHGTLAHSEDRLPRFEAFLDRVRADGMKIGLWTVPLRCASPEKIGLKPEHMLQLHKGGPVRGTMSPQPYFLLDITQPAVEANVRRRLHSMMRRYRPSLLKFDFGYEMPPLSEGAPADKRCAGEKLLIKALDVLSIAVRDVDPNVAIMYYGLSPFLAGRMDIHSPDDLYAAMGDFDIEANRRFFFSSLMGEIGIPTYGSGAYDWASMPSIWFDSVLIGSLGVLADCRGDVRGDKPTREMVALFNGLREAVRHTTRFSIQTSAVDPLSPTRGAHAPSWIRRENGKVTGVALRHDAWMGSPGTSYVQDVIETEISVVVTSCTEDGTRRASSLAIVPLCSGRLRLFREREKASANLTEHFADGSMRSRAVPVTGGICALELTSKREDGVPLEWCELKFKDA